MFCVAHFWELYLLSNVLPKCYINYYYVSAVWFEVSMYYLRVTSEM